MENALFDELYAELKRHGYFGIFGRKGFGRPDGCATFYRRRKMRFAGGRAVYFNDQERSKKPSGHVALIMKFIWDKRVIGVVNTHIRWSSPDKPIEEHKGYCQVKELIECHLSDEEVEDWIICGDFNAEEETEVIQQIKRAGFMDAYEQMKGATIKQGWSCQNRFHFLYKRAGGASRSH